MTIRVHASIHDFSPLLKSPESLFRGLKDTGVDGVELVIGFKSRWSVAYYKKLAAKYDLPIMSLHQPLWSCMGLYFDEHCFDMAKQLGVQKVTCHPLPKIPFKHPRMTAYLKRLAGLQDTLGIEILVENLPEQYNHPILKYMFPTDNVTTDVVSLYKAVKSFGLSMTLDIDHLQLPSPHTMSWFETVYPKVRNIHLSSFEGSQHHLPLYMGRFEVAQFMQELERRGYNGLLTLEVNHPSAIRLLRYDFNAIKRSVDVLYNHNVS